MKTGLWAVMALAAALLGFHGGAQAALPSGDRPIKVVVPYAAGGAADVLARLIVHRVAEQTRRNFVVENVAGANGMIAVQQVAAAAPDGRTLLFAVPGVVIFNSHLRADNQVDPHTQLAPVALLASTQFALVAATGMPFDTLQGMVKYARSHPGKLSYGSPGTGSHPHIAMEQLKKAAGIDMMHVPYKGGVPALNDLIGQRIALLFDGVVSVPQYVNTGRIKAIGVSGAKRVPFLPGVPTVGEVFAGYDSSPWYGIFAPKDAPRPLRDSLRDAFAAAIADPAVVERMRQGGFEPADSSVSIDAFNELITRDHARYGEVIAGLGLKQNK